jgi:hypothetical protein
MQTKRILFKVAAIVSAVVLVAGLISYQAGAFNWLLVPVAESTPGPTGEATVIPAVPPEATVEYTKQDPTFMYSSKSIVLSPSILKKAEDTAGKSTQPPTGSE